VNWRTITSLVPGVVLMLLSSLCWTRSYGSVASAGCESSTRLDYPAHDPGVFADLADAGEAVLLEKLDCGAEQEAALRLAPGGHLGDRLDKPAAQMGDLVERAFQRRGRDALTAVLLIDVDAGDPPVWGRGRGLVVLAAVLDARKLFGAAVLALALRGAVLVDDERGVRAGFVDAAFLCCTIVRRARPGRLGVVAHAPAAAEDPVVTLDELGERGPRGRVERPDRMRHCRSSHGYHGQLLTRTTASSLRGHRDPARSGPLSRL